METSEAVMDHKKCGARSEPGIPKSVSQVSCCICDANGSEILIQVMLVLMSAPEISLRTEQPHMQSARLQSTEEEQEGSSELCLSMCKGLSQPALCRYLSNDSAVHLRVLRGSAPPPQNEGRLNNE